MDDQNYQDDILDHADSQETEIEESVLPVDQKSEEDQSLTDVDSHNLFASLSYLAVLVLVPLFTKKDDPFVQFHAKQGLVILLGFVIAFITMFWSAVLSNLLFLLLLIVSVIGFIQALQGRRWKIPGVGHLAEKFNV